MDKNPKSKRSKKDEKGSFSLLLSGSCEVSSWDHLLARLLFLSLLQLLGRKRYLYLASSAWLTLHALHLQGEALLSDIDGGVDGGKLLSWDLGTGYRHVAFANRGQLD